MSRYGIIFRDSDGAVTDPPNTTHARGHDYDSYPATRNGVTAGWYGTYGYTASNSSWSSGNSPITYGCWRGSSGDLSKVRFDFPTATRRFKIFVLLADRSYNATSLAVRDGDAGSVLLTVARSISGGGDDTKWLENDLTAHAYSVEPDFSAMSYADVTFSNDHAILELTAGANFAQVIGVFFEEIGGSPTYSVTTQPTSTVTGTPTSTVVVTSTDTSDNTTVVTATLVGGSTLSGTTTATMASGVATFANLIPNGANTAQHYHFAASGYTAIDSANFDVTSSAPAVTKASILFL
jgi:hypothetical protein